MLVAFEEQTRIYGYNSNGKTFPFLQRNIKLKFFPSLIYQFSVMPDFSWIAYPLWTRITLESFLWSHNCEWKNHDPNSDFQTPSALYCFLPSLYFDSLISLSSNLPSIFHSSSLHSSFSFHFLFPPLITSLLSFPFLLLSLFFPSSSF